MGRGANLLGLLRGELGSEVPRFAAGEINRITRTTDYRVLLCWY
jgi:hypothetical protein